MEISVKERLLAFIKQQGISVNAFEKKCGLSTGYVANMRKSVSPDKIMSIIQNFPELNAAWLFTGEGDMIKSTESNETKMLNTYIGSDDIKKQIEQTTEAYVELLKKDVKYYADMADSRLETINVQNKIIEKLSKLVDLLEKQLTPAK